MLKGEALKRAADCLELAEASIILLITKGSEGIPAKQAEIKYIHDKIAKDQTVETIMIGDHRLNVRYITEGAETWAAIAKQWRYLAADLEV